MFMLNYLSLSYGQYKRRKQFFLFVINKKNTSISLHNYIYTEVKRSQNTVLFKNNAPTAIEQNA